MTAQPPADPATAVRNLTQAGLENLAAKASKKVDEWTDRLDDIASGGGAVPSAIVSGGEASLAGKNPVWAAVKGAWAGASAKTRVLMVLIVIAVLLAAVLLLVGLVLALVVGALVAAVRAVTR